MTLDTKAILLAFVALTPFVYSENVKSEIQVLNGKLFWNGVLKYTSFG